MGFTSIETHQAVHLKWVKLYVKPISKCQKINIAGHEHRDRKSGQRTHLAVQEWVQMPGLTHNFFQGGS